MDKDREKALDLALSQIERSFGKGTVMRLGEVSARMAVDVIPRGRVTEIFGPESSGKTTLVQHIIAEAQRGGGIAALIDAEHALDPEYAQKCGVQIDDLLVS